MKKQFEQHGFTLIELLVVISIIGFLAAVVLGNLADSREQARETRALQDLKNIHTTMEIQFTQRGQYIHGRDTYCPPTSDPIPGLPAGTPNERAITVANMPQLPQDMIDPWGTPYWFDEDYQCTAGALGCGGVTDAGNDTSAIVSCGPNKDVTGSGDSCRYDDDNIVYVFCRN